MQYLIPAFLIATFLFIQLGCKGVDNIDCSIESAFLSIKDSIDDTNPKLVHFEFINNDTDGGFALDQDIYWDFGDANLTTSTNHKTNHIYADSGDYKVTAGYILRRGDANCSGSKEKYIIIN